jgi:hypothetical protein
VAAGKVRLKDPNAAMEEEIAVEEAAAAEIETGEAAPAETAAE